MAIYSNISGVGASLVKSVDGISISRIRTINAALSSAFALLLDKPYGSDAAAAYSVRRLSGKYSGPSMTIRRDSDDETLRIGFNLNNDIDSSAIELHCAGTTCYVTKLWDQSGLGNDASQPLLLNQPTIYTGNALVKENGRVAVDFDAGDLLNTGLSISGDLDTFSVIAIDGADTRAILLSDIGGSSGSIFLQSQSASTSATVTYGAFSVSAYYQNGVSQTFSTRGDAFTKLSGQQNLISTDGTVSIAGSIGIAYSGISGYKSQEIILYNSDKSSVRTDIEENIADYYTQNTPLLDTYSGASAAYSLRKLSSSYSGPLVTVREDGGDTQADIYANIFGELDTVALAAHCGSNNGFVVSWLDQSGNSNHVTQLGEPNQPKIYDGLTGVVTVSRYPAVDFDGAGDYLDNSVSIVSDYPFSLVDVATPDTVHQGVVSSIVNSGSADESFANFYNSNDNNENQVWARNGTAFKDGPVMSAGQRDLNFLYWSSDTANGIYVNDGRGYFPGGPIAFPTVNNLAIGAFRDSTPGQYFDGKIQEVVWYPSDESTSRKGIQSNVSAFYEMSTSELIDKYPGAKAAYSLRSLSEQYDEAVVTVRRDSDDAQRNIYTLSDGQLDTSGLEDFCGTSDGFVVRWFDQSSNSNNAAQPADNNQPKIYDGITGVITENGKPAVDFGLTSTNFYLSYTDSFTGTKADFSIYAVSKTTSTNTKQTIWGEQTSFLLTPTAGFRINGGTDNISMTAAVVGAQELRTANLVESTAAYVVSVNGTATSGTGTWTTINRGSNVNLGRRSNNSWFFSGLMQEVVVYQSNQSANRTNIEQNINENYLIYQPALIAKSGLLADYSGAATAYSLRQLSDRAVMAVKVRRDSDDKQVAIGFFRGDLDTAALSNFCGTSDGFVVEWSDQSTNGNHATQPADNNQPKIYDGGSQRVVTENGKPAVEFDGGNDYLLYGIDLDLVTYSNYSNFLTCTPAGQDEVALNITDTSKIAAISYGRTNGQFHAITYDGTNQNPKSGAHTINTQALVESYHNFTSFTTNLYVNNTQQSGTNLGRGGLDDSFIGAQNATNRHWSGKIQEVITYPSDQSSNRTGIEDNIFSHYSPAPLLDTYSGAAAAYSLRKLSSSATNAFQVRRDSDDAVKYIGFVQDVFNGESLDTAALSAFCGSANGFVTEWVDQSSNSNNATQATAANQPKIYDGTAAAVVTDGTKPTIEFSTAGNSNLVFTQISDIQTIFTVRSSSGVQSRTNFMGASATNDYRSASGVLLSTAAASYVTGGNNYINGTLTTYTTTAKPTTQSLFTMIHSSASGQSDYLTQDRGSSVRSWDGPFSEIVIYNSDQSADRTNIEDNINTFYDIY